jgi:hypothetical protein
LIQDQHEVAFDQLESADLVIDRTYRGGTAGNVGASCTGCNVCAHMRHVCASARTQFPSFDGTPRICQRYAEGSLALHTYCIHVNAVHLQGLCDLIVVQGHSLVAHQLQHLGLPPTLTCHVLIMGEARSVHYPTVDIAWIS